MGGQARLIDRLTAERRCEAKLGLCGRVEPLKGLRKATKEAYLRCADRRQPELRIRWTKEG